MESLNVLINRRPNGITSAHVLSRLAERAPEPRAQGRLENRRRMMMRHLNLNLNLNLNDAPGPTEPTPPPQAQPR